MPDARSGDGAGTRPLITGSSPEQECSMSTSATRTRTRKRRVFLWVFLAIQILFLVWIITGAAAAPVPCGHELTARACADAADTGHGVALALQVTAWVVVDFLVGGSYALYQMARRP
jgi:hypothetical protein